MDNNYDPFLGEEKENEENKPNMDNDNSSNYMGTNFLWPSRSENTDSVDNAPKHEVADEPSKNMFTGTYVSTSQNEAGTTNIPSYVNNTSTQQDIAVTPKYTQIKSPKFSPLPKEKGENKNKNKSKLLVLCVILSLIFGAVGGYFSNSLFGGNSIVYKTAEGTDTNGSDPAGNGKTLSEVIDAVSGSVVEITTESVRTGNYINQYVTEGAGSGVIISSDGYIVTNNHVVSNANKVTIRTKNGESYTASVKGSDSNSDVALLKIDAKNLTAAVIGDSSTLKVGDTAIAIGNPLGQLGGTVSTGIVSALDREIEISGTKMNLLQTDAAINPGNSGGGLFNENGELIGIVVAKSSGESIEGLGFAIPVGDITDVIKDISEFGYVKGRPWLGVTLIDVSDAQTAWQYGVGKYGVYVYSVSDGSGAAKAGLKSGDLIQAIDNESVSNSSEVKAAIQKHKVGETITLSIVRDNMQQQIEVTLSESNPNLSSLPTQQNSNQR